MANRGMLTTAAALKLKPTADRREIPDTGAQGLYLVIQPSGAKSWAMRFRRPSGLRAKLVLGALDATGKEMAGEPQIGQPLTPAAARVLAGQINRQRAMGVDVVAARQTENRRAKIANASAATYPAAVKVFIAGRTVRKSGQKPRRWREDARMLGLDYPLDEGDATLIKGGLCDRWRHRLVNEITEDDIFLTIEEARSSGIPGLQRRNGSASDARGRKMANALASLFGWLRRSRQIATNPCADLDKPPGPVKRQRALNARIDTRNADELRWFWQACNSISYPFGHLCKLLLLTGCRREEMARMIRTEVADDLSVFRLPGSRTKNHLPHSVPLSALARSILISAPKISDLYVFSTNGRTPISGFSKYKRRLDGLMLQQARQELGERATISPWTLHDLRRSAATGMAGIGIAPHIIESALNHVSGAKAGVAGTYNAELYMPERTTALNRWASYIDSVVSGRVGDTILPMHGRAV